MVVSDFDIFSAIVGPHETDAVLIVDTNTVLPLAVTAQCFKSVSRRNAQIQELRGGIDVVELSGRHIPYRLWATLARSLGVAPVEYVFGSVVLERGNHTCMIARRTCYSKSLRGCSDRSAVQYSELAFHTAIQDLRDRRAMESRGLVLADTKNLISDSGYRLPVVWWTRRRLNRTPPAENLERLLARSFQVQLVFIASSFPKRFRAMRAVVITGSTQRTASGARRQRP